MVTDCDNDVSMTTMSVMTALTIMPSIDNDDSEYDDDDYVGDYYDCDEDDDDDESDSCRVEAADCDTGINPAGDTGTRPPRKLDCGGRCCIMSPANLVL